MPRRRIALALALSPGCVPDDWRDPGRPDATNAADATSPDVRVDVSPAPDVPASPDVPAAGDVVDAPASPDAVAPTCPAGQFACDGVCVEMPATLYRGDGDARDAVGARHATANAVTYGGGRYGRAFVINGSPGYVQIPSAVGDLGAGEFTIALWFNSTLAGHFLSRRAACWGAPPSVGEDLGVALDGSVAAEVLVPSDYFLLRSGTGFNDGAWHHVTLARRGDVVELSVDGRVAASHAFSRAFDDPTASPSYIGTSRCAPGAPGANGTTDNRSWYYGRVDEVAYYRRALSPAELVAQAAGRCHP